MVRVLIAHNRYQTSGGEETAVAQDAAMLREAGHAVSILAVDNDSIRSTADKIRAAVNVAHNPSGVARVKEAVERTGAEIVHVHNFFPLLSPGIHRAAHGAGAAVVQTLHNYRTVCANGLLLRNGSPCEKCVTGSPLWGIAHRCYRGSLIGSIAVAHMVQHHRRAGTWRDVVDRFVVLSEFARAKFVAAGFPVERMIVRPSAVDDPGSPQSGPRRHLLYVGRLSQEKGVGVLIEAARSVDAEFIIAGEGPLERELKEAAPRNVRFTGRLPRDEVRVLMAEAKALVLPSVCYEGSPMTLSEAYAAGTPVIGSRLGSLIGLIEHGRTGLHATPGDAADLALQIRRVVDGDFSNDLGVGARSYYEAHLCPAKALATLEAVYAGALNRRVAYKRSRKDAISNRVPVQP